MPFTVSLIDHDSKIPNLALMKLSSYHKGHGHAVNLNMPLFPSDITYVSKVFSFSDDIQIPGFFYAGGQGYDPSIRLPEAVDHCFPDYDLYNVSYSLGYTTRGCPRRCPFCNVWAAEGDFHIVGDLYSVWDRRHSHVDFLDDNILVDPDHFARVMHQVYREGITCRVRQGLDFRLFSHKVLVHVVPRYHTRVGVSWDRMSDEDTFKRSFELLLKHVPYWKVQVCFLVGYDTSFEEDMRRVLYLKKFHVGSWCMVWNKRRDNPLLWRFQHWSNGYHVYHMPFETWLRSHHMEYLLRYKDDYYWAR